MAPNSSASPDRAALAILGVGLLIGLAAGALIFFGLPALPRLGGGDPSVGPKATPAPIAGAPAPDFTLDDISGSAVTLSGLKGQVVLINFWATWCGPCRFEMPAIEARYAAHKDQGFTVLAVDADEPEADVSAFAQSLNLTFPVLLDPGAKVNDLYRIRGYPTTFLVDREGLIAKLHIGVMSEAQLEGYLADLGIK